MQGFPANSSRPPSLTALRLRTYDSGSNILRIGKFMADSSSPDRSIRDIPIACAGNNASEGTGFHELAASAAASGGADLMRIERAVREILIAVGEDPDREGLQETPARVARMYAEMFSGLRKDPAVVLRKTFTEKYDEMVLVKNIGFESMCEHHLLPFFGKAHIAYLPNGKIAGLSKLARVVEILSKRPQVQERMTEHIADLVMGEL